MNDMTESPLPASLYTAASVRQMDRYAIETLGIPGPVLMERAGQACFGSLRTAWPQARTLSVLTGAGNNGGDGFVIARLAHQAGLGCPGLSGRASRSPQGGCGNRLAGIP